MSEMTGMQFVPIWKLVRTSAVLTGKHTSHHRRIDSDQGGDRETTVDDLLVEVKGGSVTTRCDVT
jgi:hypothetical protein